MTHHEPKVKACVWHMLLAHIMTTLAEFMHNACRARFLATELMSQLDLHLGKSVV